MFNRVGGSFKTPSYSIKHLIYFGKVEALHKFRSESPQFPLLCEVYKRAKGQLNNHAPVAFQAGLLKEKAEIDLDAILTGMQQPFQQALASKNYDQAYQLVAQIQPALASLFDQVKILADDPVTRENHIALLQRVFALFAQLIDFSKIQL